MAKATTKGGGRTTPKKAAVSDPQLPTEGYKILSVEDLTTPHLPEQTLPIPELGGAVRIRGFSGSVARQAREFATDAKGELADDLYEIALVHFGVVEPVLPIDVVKDMFDNQNSMIVRRIALAVMMLNGAGSAAQLAKDLG